MISSSIESTISESSSSKSICSLKLLSSWTWSSSLPSKYWRIMLSVGKLLFIIVHLGSFHTASTHTLIDTGPKFYANSKRLDPQGVLPAAFGRQHFPERDILQSPALVIPCYEITFKAWQTGQALFQAG